MKNIYAIPGAILVILALLLVAGFSSSLGQGLNSVGVSNQQTIYTSPTKLLSLKSSSISELRIPIPMKANDVLSASIQSNPKGIDAFVMTHDNFSEFEASGGDTGGGVNILAKSLNVSSASLSFSPNTAGNYSLVFTVPVPGINPDVIVSYTITRTVTSSMQNYLPYAIAIIGIILLAIGVMSRSGNAPVPVQKKQVTAVPAKTAATTTSAQAVTQPKCRYCGALMKPGQVICPSCTRSQV